MSNQLVKTFKQDNGQIAVDGRELHDFLEVETPYTMWIDRMVEYGFDENVDFSVFNKKVNDDTAFGGIRKVKDHALTLEMAKELSMIQRTEKGKQARQYFIYMENVAKKQDRLPQTNDEKIVLLLENAHEDHQLITRIDERVTDLEEDQSLNPGEYNYISKRVNQAVAAYVSLHHLVLNKEQRSKLYKDINGGVKQVTGVKTRSQLRRKNFDDADEFIGNWIPSTATLQVIKQLGEEPQQTELV